MSDISDSNAPLNPEQALAMELGERTFISCAPFIRTRAEISQDAEHFYASFLSCLLGAVAAKAGGETAQKLLTELMLCMERENRKVH